MKKIPNYQLLFTVIGTAAIVLLPAITVLAQGTPAEPDQGIIQQMGQAISGFKLPGGSVNTAEDRAFSIVGGIINAFLSLFGVFFMILIIYGGYRWMNARGNESEMDAARDIIRGAIIGFIIVVASFALSFFVANALQNL